MAMAQFDPKLRLETWVLSEVSRDARQRKTYRRLGFNLVEYDGNPDRYLEPRPASDRYDQWTDYKNMDLLDPTNDGRRVVDFEFSEGTNYQGVHRFD